MHPMAADTDVNQLPVLKVAGRWWTEDEIRSVRSMAANDEWTLRQIASHFNVNPYTFNCPRVKKTLSLPKRKQGRKLGSDGRAVYRRPPELQHAHPLVRRFYELAIEQKRFLGKIAKEAGVDPHTIGKWRHAMPRVDNLQAVLNVMGYELVIVSQKVLAQNAASNRSYHKRRIAQ